MEMNDQLHSSDALPPTEISHGTRRIGGCVGPRNGLDGFGEQKNIMSLGGLKPQIVQLAV